MLDALRQVIHLRAYAQKKPIDEYKHEAFQQFERMLGAIREDVTRTLAFATFTFQQPDLPDMPDFVTHHIDPFTGEDDSADLDAATGNVLSRLPPLQVPRPEMPGDTAVRSEERRVGKECVITCSSRGSPYP